MAMMPTPTMPHMLEVATVMRKSAEFESLPLPLARKVVM